MKSSLLVVLACLIASSLFAADTSPRRFQSLSEAAEFLDRTLGDGDRPAILGVIESPDTAYFSKHPAVFATLVEQRKQVGTLSKLYSGRSFPMNADTFKLGGHDSELGHIHIDFVRDQSGWRLKDIWICR